MCRWVILLVLVLVLAVAGCGDSDDDDGGSSEVSGTELTVTLDPDGPQGDPAQTETATCAEGAAASACARLDANDFAPLDPATPCTEIYGGPDEVTLEGTVSGEAISATLTRANGCEIERFDRLTPLLRELFSDYRPGASLTP